MCPSLTRFRESRPRPQATDRSSQLVRLLILALASSVVLSGLTPIVGATADPRQTSVQPAESATFLSSAPEDVEASQVRMDVELAENGTAEWTVEFLIQLDDDESVEAFESIRDDVEEDPKPYLDRFEERIETTVVAASNATDREMVIDGFDVETERQTIARDYGVIRYTFDWQGFAAVDEPELRAGDAIEGLYLDEGTRLLIAWPEEYDLAHAEPEPDERRDSAAIWYGSETDFVSGEPVLVVSSGWAGPTIAHLAVGAVALVAFAFGGTLWYRRRGDAVPAPTPAPRRDPATSGPPVDDSPEPARDLPEEFLSNEERVLRLVEENGGRIKQQDVVSGLDWTDAKTSKVVTGLREEGKLESFRLGRENVLTVADREEPEFESED